MLDSTTKRRIDDCRDILVGKVPDPKSQIDQITVALIYKFMHDMDQEAVELGGKPTFFAKHTVKVKVIENGKEKWKDEEKDFAKYAWPHLMATALGGEDRVKLYAEALEKMPENPGLPPLFRDIFKNTYLPYRDPATLREFLKRINEFTYDHSEKLGDAFEYLLSIMGSQGDAGQFRTPRHLIDFMTAVIDPQKHETILDPACGTAGFLISAYKHILRHNSSNHAADDPLAFQLHGVRQEDLTVSAKRYTGDKLTPDQRKKLVRNIVGYDIDPGMVKLSLVNLYLHGFPEPHIHEYDTLTSTDRWEERFDVVLANPPFMSPKGGIQPHGKFGIPSTRSEVLFVDYIAEHLNPNGRALVVVPEGIIFQSGKAYKALRKKLVDEHFLVGVVSIPGGVFNPYSGVKTSLLWFDRALARKTDKLLFVKVEADGFDLGAQRRPIAQNDLPEAFALILDYKRALAEGVRWEAPKGWEAKAVEVEREQIAKNGEYSLSGERYGAAVVASNGEWPHVALEDVCDLITKGTTPTSVGFNFTETGVSFVKVESLTESGSIIPEKLAHINEACNEALRRSQLKAGDVLFSIAGTLGRVGVVPESILPANTNQALAIIRPKSVLNSKFVMLCLTDSGVQDELYGKRSGVAQYNLSLKQIGETKIPLPPLAEQEALVAEVEGYQRVIDGARQVLAHYKPRITIDPQWEMVELGEVTSFFTDGDWIESKDQSPEGIRLIQTGNIGIGEYLERGEKARYISPETFVRLNCTQVLPGDVLVSRLPDPVGRACMIPALPGKLITGVDCSIIRFDQKKMLPGFFVGYTQSDEYLRSIQQKLTGSTRLRISRSNLGLIKIPLPPLAEQQRIVAELEEERRLVAANAALVARMEARIKERVARVWGLGSARPDTPADDQKIESKPLSTHYPDRDEEVSMAAEPSPEIERRGPGRIGPGRPRKGEGGNGQASEAIKSYLHAHPGWHGKGAVLEATGVEATAWNAAIKELQEAGQAERQGEKKGARYRGV
ncbi:MAG TPA: N-6 DNA methylase [Flavobacteriales bacterium]|nr:N-6 DNA methylase [Flavobacteriales bacterium]